MKFIDWLKNTNPNKSQWSKIINYNCAKLGITSLEGIENLTSLQFLTCSGNNIKSLKGVENLKNLFFISCNNNNITNLKELSNLNKISKIHCDGNDITSLESIMYLSSLTTLYCSNNKLKYPFEVNDIRDLPNLRKYHLKENIKKFIS